MAFVGGNGRNLIGETFYSLLSPRQVGENCRCRLGWPEVNAELKRKGVTLALLWQEYKERNPDGYQYSWFCEHYEQWRGTIDLVMRQSYRAGEKMFVDYAGHTIDLINQQTGEVKSAQIFVAVLGASNYTRYSAWFRVLCFYYW